MIRRTLGTLMRLAPADFRERCGDELVEAHVWRLARRADPASRAVFVIREVVGLSGVVLRLRGRSLRRRVGGRLRLAGGALAPDPGRWGGPALALSPVLLMTGNAIAFGAGRQAGFALAPPALILLGWGLAARARTAGSVGPGVMRAIRLTAISSWTLAALIAVLPLTSGAVGAGVAGLRYPVCLGILSGLAATGVIGALRRQLPLLPSALLPVAVTLVAAGMIGYERIALTGAWIAAGCCVALALLPWSPARPAEAGRATT